jgi:hypothetical protein
MIASAVAASTALSSFQLCQLLLAKRGEDPMEHLLARIGTRSQRLPRSSS